MDSEQEHGARTARQRPVPGRHRAPAGYEPGDGCLVELVRIPVRIVAVLVVLPVRVARDLLVVTLRALDRSVLRPLGRGAARVWRHLVVRPVVSVWTYRPDVPRATRCVRHATPSAGPAGTCGARSPADR
ncbi:hypothetical protein [Streptomyces sp. NPDC060184]|uniref:hypothetical protein n=1 Tax=Streptomyces sp. NPDC060184 TaxID=3347064 RepID=UPI003667FFAC